MGRQWLQLYKQTAPPDPTTNSNSNSNSAGKSRRKRSSRSGRRRRRHNSLMSSPSSSSSLGGCMSAIFHIFDNIQHHQHHYFPCFHQPPNTTHIHHFSHQQPPSINILNGVEAPRNSLELDEQLQPQLQTQRLVVQEAATASSSSTSLSKLLIQQTDFKIPMMGGIQIKTKRSRLLMEADQYTTSECSSSSPGSKTPNLVARLMGLDLLPENSSSPRASSCSSSSHKNNTRSLPATPRISTAAARPSTDDYHHRLSHQINNNNKENMVKRTYDQTTNEYARQIAKQVRENISRRVVGADITNTVVENKKKERRRDELLVVLKPQRRPSSPPPSSATFIHKPRNLDQGHDLRAKENEVTPAFSCLPRQTLSEINNINNLYKPNSDSPKSSSSASMSSTKVIISPTTSSSTTKLKPLMKQGNHPAKAQKCNKRIASEKFDLRLKKLNQQEQVFVKKLCKNKMKSTPLSNHLVNVNMTTTKFISFKKDMASTTISSQKQVPLGSITQLPICQKYQGSYNTTSLSVKDDVTTNGNDVAVSEYISRILSHSGIENTTPISITQWYSPSHPLHPSIFNQLEKILIHNDDNTLADRKLIFDVVDELLVEILKPYISLKPWAAYYSSQRYSRRMYGSELRETLREKIHGFPAADCRVLEDIDGLIEGDMSMARAVGAIAFEEVAEEVVAEIERDMVDTLVGEMAAAGIIWHVGYGNRV